MLNEDPGKNGVKLGCKIGRKKEEEKGCKKRHKTRCKMGLKKE